ncbi:hypothetical protein BJX61DRAFT_539936, partial [Aspergillus egyptiacus]
MAGKRHSIVFSRKKRGAKKGERPQGGKPSVPVASASEKTSACQHDDEKKKIRDSEHLGDEEIEDNNCEGTRSLISSGTGTGSAASHPGDEPKNPSYATALSHETGYGSIHNTEEKHDYSCSEAAAVLHSRTVTCHSDSERSSGNELIMQTSRKKTSPSSPPESSAPVPPDSMDLTKASIMDFVVKEPKKKKNKNKKKSKKGGRADTRSKSSAEERGIQPEQGSKGSLPSQSQDDDAAEPEAGEQAKHGAAEHAPDTPLNKGIKDLHLEETVESAASNKAAALPASQPSSAKQTLDATDAPKTPEHSQAKATDSNKLSSQKTPARDTASMIGTEKASLSAESQLQHPDITPGQCTSTPQTPDTESTASTVITNPFTQPSPETTTTATTSGSPTAHRNKHNHKDTTTIVLPHRPPIPLPGTPAPIRTHAHPSSSPSPSRNTTTSTSTNIDLQRPTTTGIQNITTQKPPGFFWQLDSHGFPCSLPSCPARCNLWDGASVICPRCGPYSETRYCGLAHLLTDIKRHWPSCGENVFKHPCRESSIPMDIREEQPPLIPCLHRYDTPERHRQAVHFSMNSRQGDYFIFSDWVDMVERGVNVGAGPNDNGNDDGGKVSDFSSKEKKNLALRCSSRVLHVVRIPEDQPEEKDRFRRVLAACLFLTLEAHELVDYLYRLIRDNLRSSTTPTTTTTSMTTLLSALRHQLFHETAVTIQPYITGERHACATDWTGVPRRTCTDAVCRAEYRPLLGALGGRGHGTLLDHLEAQYWVLRVARTTHPRTKRARDRMLGIGFEGVAEEDRRAFCRGDGWDGAGSGEME